MNKLLSEQIKMMSVLCTFLVVWRHSTNMVAFYGVYEQVPLIVSQTEWTLSQFTNVAVPLFFMISGFFFFSKSYYQIRSYAAMLKKKGCTLFIPFLIWNVIGFGILLIAHEIVLPHSFFDFLYGILMSEYDGVLWFVRNLMIMMLLYPLYGWLFVINRWWLYIPILIGLIIWWIPDDCSIYSSQGWFFFLSGGIIGNKCVNVLNHTILKEYVLLFLGIWIGMCLCFQYGGAFMAKATIILGIISVFAITNSLSKYEAVILLKISPYCFFIYVTHVFLIKALKITAAQMFYQDMIMALVAYFLLPLITFCVLLCVGWRWKRLAPVSYNICVGGRG